jgi:hypothetical protein
VEVEHVEQLQKVMPVSTNSQSITGWTPAEALLKVLNLNAPVAPGKDPGELYKILILDRYTKLQPAVFTNCQLKQGLPHHAAGVQSRSSTCMSASAVGLHSLVSTGIAVQHHHADISAPLLALWQVCA